MNLKSILLVVLSLLIFRMVTKVKRPTSFEDFKKLNFYQSYTTIDKCFPKEFLQPKTSEEIVEIVKKSIKTKQIIKLVGSGHTLNGSHF
jgi:ribosomal protein L14E/L6E/L27E